MEKKTLIMWLSRLKNSMKAHPDYFTGTNQEFIDFVEGAEEVLEEAQKELTQPSAEAERGNLNPDQIEEREEAINWYRNPAADDVLNFAEWAATIAFFDDGTRLWELIGEGEAINGQFRFTTKEFFEIYKRDESAGEKEVTNG